MSQFSFATDDESEVFCFRIASEMVKLFGISQSEAVGRINKHWQGQKFVGPDMIYHRDTVYWANRIYYTDDTYWWLDWWLAENTPKAKPYP
jgi:hypothetical protein